MGPPELPADRAGYRSAALVLVPCQNSGSQSTAGTREPRRGAREGALVGSLAIRRRKLASIRPASGIDTGRAKPPASSAGVCP
jgi:hypothetical protein